MAASGTQLAAQLLLCPPTDYKTQRLSGDLFSEGLFLSKADLRWFHEHYLQGADPGDVRVSPLLARSFAGIAPAVVVTADLDVLRDEGVAYAAALADNGALVEHIRAAGLGHGFANLAGFHTRSRQCVERAAKRISEQLVQL